MVVVVGILGIETPDPGVNVRTGNLPPDQFPVSLGAGILLGRSQVSEKLLPGGLARGQLLAALRVCVCVGV